MEKENESVVSKKLAWEHAVSRALKRLVTIERRFRWVPNQHCTGTGSPFCCHRLERSVDVL
jgi:hypothetical protein